MKNRKCISHFNAFIIHRKNYGAGDGNRTHVSSLEGWCSTIELHPHGVSNDKNDYSTFIMSVSIFF